MSIDVGKLLHRAIDIAGDGPIEFPELIDPNVDIVVPLCRATVGDLHGALIRTAWRLIVTAECGAPIEGADELLDESTTYRSLHALALMCAGSHEDTLIVDRIRERVAELDGAR